MIDFTNAPIDLMSNYGGSDQKRGIIYNNKRYMLKLSDRIETDEDSLKDSYSKCFGSYKAGKGSKNFRNIWHIRRRKYIFQQRTR